jgi:uncharacterized caspase-like protein
MIGKAWPKIVALGTLLFLASGFAAHADKRVALVIGNSGYQNTPTLANPVNDAEDLAGALKRVGFDVVLERNLSKRSMEQAIGRFARHAQDADTALFFFAGHGIQHRGLNYLVPIDASLEDEFSLNFDVTRVDDVLFALERARGVKILVLDACRDNPLLDRLTRTAATRELLPTKGLAKIEPTRGMVIAYSTQANQIAVDGGGRNSPFATALVQEIDQPGVEIGTLFRRVAADVHRTTKGRQLPELSISLVGEFYLNTRETDLQAWAKIRDSDNPGDLTDFITRYPVSVLVHDARQRLAALERADKARVERERALREQVERERLERENLTRQQAEREQREQAVRERVQREHAAREEAKRRELQREQERQRELAESERIERERLAKEDAARESAQSEAAAQAEEDRQRVAREQAERQKAEPAAAAAKTQTVMLTPPAEASSAPSKPIPTLSGSALVQEIKKELRRVGCYAGRLDDKWMSAEMKSSVNKFVKYAKLSTAPREPEIDFLESLRGHAARVCPLECSPREVERNRRCVTKSCPSGSTLGSNGNCERQKERVKTASQPAKTPLERGTQPPQDDLKNGKRSATTTPAPTETKQKAQSGGNPSCDRMKDPLGCKCALKVGGYIYPSPGSYSGYRWQAYSREALTQCLYAAGRR